MPDLLTRAVVSCGLLLSVIVSLASNDSLGQRPQRSLVCTQPALAALKPKPELSYPCDGQPNDFDEKVLKLPARVSAIKTLSAQLSSLTDAAWWTSSTQDLNVCDFTHEPGTLTPDQRRAFADGDYLFWLFGNDRLRLVLIADPCYQTEYGGSNAFLLNRHGGRVVVTQVLDGYFSRADNSVNIAFAKLSAEEIIEVSTGTGGLNPSLTNFYFVLDPQGNAVPKILFTGKHGPTNEISSAMLFGATPASAPLKIFQAHALTRSFNIYLDDPNGKIDDNGRTLSRQTFRWNGKVYR